MWDHSNEKVKPLWTERFSPQHETRGGVGVGVEEVEVGGGALALRLYSRNPSCMLTTPTTIALNLKGRHGSSSHRMKIVDDDVSAVKP